MQQHRDNPFRLRAALTVAPALLVLAACATSAPAPTAALDSARSAIVAAERSDAGRYASVDLAEAREKLAQADTATQAEQMERAGQLAVESRVSAELAAARTEAAKAAAVNKDLGKGTKALVEEMDRAGEAK